MGIRARVIEASVEFVSQRLARPLVLSSGAIEELTEARASVRVEVEGAGVALGRGSIYLSDLWSWPEPRLSHAQRDSVLRGLSEAIARSLPQACGGGAAHPLELGLRLHDWVAHEGPEAVAHDAKGEADPLRPPILALAMAASPFDAAVHDAVGGALGRSAFALYAAPAAAPSADALFPGRGAVAAIGAMLRPEPVRAFDVWHIVGKDDDLQRDVGPWVRERGVRAFKLKIQGRDARVDAERTAAVFRAARSLGVARPRLTVDSNEANPDAANVMEFLERLRRDEPAALAALEYLEQPTGRDILVHRHDWRAVSAVRPVLLDEGLTSLELLDEAARQGWTGLALKTCKGQSFALVAAAWAHQRGMPCSLQDLTNPGLALMHAALFAAWVPTINGAELNSPQFTPRANLSYAARLPELYEPQDGTHRLPADLGVGLGSGRVA